MWFVREKTAQIVIVILLINLTQGSIYSTVQREYVCTLGLRLAHLPTGLVRCVKILGTDSLVADGDGLLIGCFVEQISEPYLLIACVTQVQVSQR